MLGEGGNEPFDVGGEEGGERVVASAVELLREAVPQVEGDVGDLVVLLLNIHSNVNRSNFEFCHSIPSPSWRIR